MTARIWILGAPDPEMAAIESLLHECGERYAYAGAVTTTGFSRISPGTAYKATCHQYAINCGDVGDSSETWYLVECDTPTPAGNPVVPIDHHRPGDPGFGSPPSEFLRASSLGQVIDTLCQLDALPASWDREPYSGHYCDSFAIHDFGTNAQRFVVVRSVGDASVVAVPSSLILTAAADHCLGAAYRGECPGVDPDELMRWRAESRAKFQGRSVAEILSDVSAARAALQDAPVITLLDTADMPHTYDHDWSRSVCAGCNREPVVCRDMRGQHVAELPEAGTRYGIAYIAEGLPDGSGRIKVVCSGTKEVVTAFLTHWADRNDLYDCYGDPERGFAGGYV